jgi:acetyltransferase-like isoleucine patch superfamily enzyme
MESSRLRWIVMTASLVAPQGAKRRLFRRLLGWRVAESARIGLSWIDVRDVSLGEDARIGHFTVARDLTILALGDRSTIGQWNWLSASPAFLAADRAAGTSRFRGLRIGHDSAITSRHYIDCSGGVTVGHHTTIGGVRSTILTHQISLEESRQTTSGVDIGDYCFVSSNVTVTPGSTLADRTVVAMGATVAGALPEGGVLYAGVPARPIRRDIGSFLYFKRRLGAVSLEPSDTATTPNGPESDAGATTDA